MKNSTDESIQNVDNPPSQPKTGTGIAPITHDRFARYRARHKERLKARSRERYHADIEKNRAYFRKWQADARAKNPELIEKVKKWNREHPEAHRRHVKESLQRNLEKRRAYERNYWPKRRANDPNVKLRSYIRGRMSKLLRGNIKCGSTLSLIGCSIPNLWIYLESKFQKGMTKDNYGTVWEVDHIVPCASFDFTKPDDQRRCCHFSNLQPLFISENRSKGARTENQPNERIQAIST